MAPSGLQFIAWHPLLVRTLKTFLNDRRRVGGVRLGSLLAILSRLPIPDESLSAVDDVLPALRAYIQSLSLADALSCVPDVSRYFCDDSTGIERHGSLRLQRKQSKKSSSHSSKKKTTTEFTAALDSEKEGPFFNRIKSVHVHERVLLSDSDGFAAYTGDVPPAGNELVRSEIDDNCLFSIYRSIFGVFPTLFTPLDCLVNSLTVHSKFAMRTSVPTGISVLCEFFENQSGKANFTDDSPVSRDLFLQWICWQAILRQTSRSLAQLARASRHVVGYEFDRIQHGVIGILLDNFGKNICASARMNAFLRSGEEFDEMHLACVDDAMRATHEVTIRLFEDLLALISVSRQKANLSRIGDYVISWSDDPQFRPIMKKIISIVESKLGIGTAVADEQHVRFTFELFASLVDISGLSNAMLDWCLHLPIGFKKSVTGIELLGAISGHVLNHPDKCSQILKRHLPLMMWSTQSRASSFTGIISEDTLPSEAVVRFCQDVLSQANQDTLVLMCTVILPYCDPFDTEFLLIHAVVPSIETNCRKNFYDAKTNSIIVTQEMSPGMKEILKGLELLAAYLKTKDASTDVIRKIVCPYRDFYFSASELQDVFIAVCSKAVRHSPIVAMETGLCEWMIDRVTSLRQASIDIWLFVEDSAAKFSKLLISMLNLIGEVVENGPEVFSILVDKLRNATSSLVDVCFEWLANPVCAYRSVVRISKIISKSLSIHLLISSDMDDVIVRFTAALLRSLGENPPEILISILSCSLLDRCISRIPQTTGSLMSIDRDSEDDALMGEGSLITIVPTRRVLHSQLVPAVLFVVSSILSSKTTFEAELEFMVSKICSRLNLIDNHSQEGPKWMPQLFSLCSEIIRLKASTSSVISLLHLIITFIKRDPKSKDIYELIAYFHRSVEYKDTVLSAFNVLLNGDPVEPIVSLLFPQPLLEQPVEIQSAAHGVAVSRRMHNEEMQLTTESNRLHAVDKFLTAKRSDGETENERRREKRKHLRDHVRGHSMVDMDLLGSQNSRKSSCIDISESAASFTLDDGISCSAADGLTLSFWLKRKLISKTISRFLPLHVVSLGGEELSCSCWLNGKGRLSVEISSSDIKFAKVRLKGTVREDSWTHVTFGFRVTEESIVIQASVGDSFTTKEVPTVVKLEKPSFSVTVSFGSFQKRNHHQYSISTIFGLKGLLPPSGVLTLHSLGCRLNSLSETSIEYVVPNIANITTWKLISNRQHTIEMIRQDPVKQVQKVQRAVVFVVRAASAHSFGVSVLPPDIESSYLVGRSALSMARLMFYHITWRGGLVQETRVSPNDHMTPVGGIRFILYLYAKTVNDGLSAEVQRRALDLLLSCVSRGILFTVETGPLHLENVLTRILASPLAVINEDLVNSLLCFCIDGSEKQFDLNSSQMSSIPQLDFFHAVIRHPDLLVVLCCRSEIWRGERFSFWRSVIHSICNAIDPVTCRGSHGFNRNQLANADMLPKLLHCIQEMLQDPKNFPDFGDEEEFVKDVRTIVQSLLGCPETPQSVSQLWHFIFLSHPPNHTYIDHRVQGHTSWLQPELFRDDPEGEIVGDSQLCRRLTKYTRLLGNDFISSSWKNGLTPYEMRRRFEATAEDSDKEETTSDDATPSTGSQDSVLDLPEVVIKDVDKQDEVFWVVSLRASMMDLLATVMQNGADSLLSCLQHDVISWHALVILLSHQNNPKIRDAVMDMLQKFLLRCPPYTKTAFLRLQGFQILATQLRAYPPTPAIADFLFSMMCGETIRLGDGLDQTHLISMKIDRMSCESLHAIFVIYEGSAADAPLFWNITNALFKTFENNSQLQQAMIDYGLVDVMVAVLRRIAYLPLSKEYEVVMDRKYSSIQIECWTAFAQQIIVSSVPYRDSLLGSSCERFIWLLQMADIQAAKDMRFPEDKRLAGHKVIRSQLCQMLHCWLESIHTMFNEEGRSASATSSVDSLYNRAGNDSPSSSSTSSDRDFDYCDDAITPERANLLDGTSPVAAFLTGSFANLRERLSNMGPISKNSLKCKYKKRVGPASLASIELLTERMLFALDNSSIVFSVLMPPIEPPEEEENLFHFFLYFMLSSWKREKESSQSNRSGQSIWNRLALLCRDRVRVLLAELVAFVLFPAHRKLYQTAIASRTDAVRYPNWKTEWVDEKRRQIVRALTHELQNRQSLSSIVSVNLDYEYALCLGLYDLAFISEMQEEFESDLTGMMRFLCSGKMGSSLSNFTAESLCNLTTDEVLSLHSYSQFRKSIMAQMRSKVETYLDEEGKLTAEIGGVAMEVTREVVEQLNLPRKVFIKASKQAIGEFIDVETTLRLISKEVCHPEAPGFEERHWPRGWALDPTEGPMRERRRLMPYNYPFEKRFFSEEKKKDLERGAGEQPLQNLMGTPISMRSIQESGQIDERIRLFLDAVVLRGTFECEGELHVGESRLHFIGDKAHSTQKGTSCSAITFSWSFDQLKEIQKRNHLLQDVALEVFLTNGETYFIVFQNAEKREQFMKLLLEAGFAHIFINAENVAQSVVNAWRHGSLSNFEYLTLLNKLAGRSYNDLMQYPVFPFILSDYTSAILDLSNPASFRNLTKPMAIQDKRMEAHYLSNYSNLLAECRTVDSVPQHFGLQHFGPYHYGSHYSNSGIVVHYLVRLSPFTQIALEYQDNNFDIPDRLFNSIEATWRLASSDSTTDFKELIPEFFYLSEFLTNRDDLELGFRQGGDRVGAVNMPDWIPDGNSRLFILIHRQALEANAVTASLHSWVDLIFGFKQTGKAALDAMNLFHPATYLGHLNADELSDELSASALKTMIRTYGQMPIQIVQTPHQPHLLVGKEKKEKEKEKERFTSPLLSVVGVRWGDYVGSPEQDLDKINVTLSVRVLKSDRIASLFCFLDGSVGGVPRGTILLTNSVPESSDFLCKTRVQTTLAAMSWSFSDSVLRFRNIQPELLPWVNVMDINRTKISDIAYSSTNQLLFISYISGLIRVYRLVFDGEGMQSIDFQADLLAHTAPVSCLSVCDEYSIAVSGDSDGKVIVWDINRLTFVRLIRKPSYSVTAVCISSTTADIAVVSQPHTGYGSCVELFTVNGDLVGSVETSTPVVCIAMTNQPEGAAINCMALGMQDGHIKLVEMWCLTVVRDIWHEGHTDPITSVAFAQQGRKLFALLASGRVLCWQSVATMPKTKAPQFSIINPHEMSG